MASGDEPVLSAELRSRTMAPHQRLEKLLGLPGSIRSAGDYADWLGRFLGIYEPIERALTFSPEWTSFAPARQPHSQSARIRFDLAALGVDAWTLPRASAELSPKLPTVAHAVGAIYVIEGAKLGGRLILRDLDLRLGAGIAGATSFFSSQGGALPSQWNEIRGALDRFGRGRPEVRADVVAGAERTFEAMLAWFRPFCAARTMRS